MADKLCALADEDEVARPADLGRREVRSRRHLPDLTAERLQAHARRGALDALPAYARPSSTSGVRLADENCERVEIPYERKHLVGALRPRRRRRGSRADSGSGQRPRFDQGDEVPRRPAALARAARRVVARRRPAGHRRGAAPARPDRALRQRALGEPDRRLARDARRRRPGADRPRGRLARRLLLPARGRLRAALRLRRRLGRQPRLARRAEEAPRARGQLPGAALLGARLLGLGREGRRRVHADRRERPSRRRRSTASGCRSSSRTARRIRRFR